MIPRFGSEALWTLRRHWNNWHCSSPDSLHTVRHRSMSNQARRIRCWGTDQNSCCSRRTRRRPKAILPRSRFSLSTCDFRLVTILPRSRFSLSTCDFRLVTILPRSRFSLSTCDFRLVTILPRSRFSLSTCDFRLVTILPHPRF